MDFRDILRVASEQQGLNIIPKRYSLAVGPPQRDPKVKGVQSAAVQAFLKRKEEELRKKALEEKRRKEELVKKRIELKHDKKGRAAGRRTKDNSYGAEGILLEEKSKRKPVVERPTGRGADQERLTEGEAEPLDYYQTESEDYERQETPLKTVTKPKAPPPMNFTDLLRLAEKKQHEPLETNEVKKREKRPRTAEELGGKEFLEQKHKIIDRGKEKKMFDREKKLAPTMSQKVCTSKESVHTKHRGPRDRYYSSGGNCLPQIGAEKKSRPVSINEKSMRLQSTKFQPGETTKIGSGDVFQHSQSNRHIRLLLNGAGKTHPNSYSMGTKILKTVVCDSQKSNEHRLPKSPSSHPSHSKSGAISTPQDKTRNSGTKQPGNSSGSTLRWPGIGTAHRILSPSLRRHNGSSSSGPEQQTNGLRCLTSSSGTTGLHVNGSIGHGYPTNNVGSSGCPISGTGPQGLTVTPLRQPASGLSGPGCSHSGVPRRSVSSLDGPGRPVSSSGGPGRKFSGSLPPLKPRCTVSESVSSKNTISWPGNRMLNGMRPLPPTYRPSVYLQGTKRSPFPPMAQKRYLEEDEDEYDSEMEDFIDDEGEPQEEISKHIREIFGYDRNKYKDESDYALRYMESSWREQQKEEAKSLRLGMQEDLEEMRREKEELKQQKAKKMKLH